MACRWSWPSRWSDCLENIHQSANVRAEHEDLRGQLKYTSVTFNSNIIKEKDYYLPNRGVFNIFWTHAVFSINFKLMLYLIYIIFLRFLSELLKFWFIIKIYMIFFSVLWLFSFSVFLSFILSGLSVHSLSLKKMQIFPNSPWSAYPF